MEDVFLIAAKRTAIGGFLGSLSSFSATDLGAIAIGATWKAAGLNPEAVESVYMGNVLSADLGQSPARQAAIRAGIPDGADCTTVNKVCASGLKAVMLGAQQIGLNQANVVVAGGMESMSNVPHYTRQRKASKLGDSTLTDGLLKDGLIDPYHNFHMGNAAELCVREFNLSRAAQDDFALNSYRKSARATSEGKFANEIISIPLTHHGKELTFNEDEDIKKIIPEKVPSLRPVFQKDGTITAANASNLNDGAAALLLASEEAMVEHRLRPLARVVSYADAAQAPEKFTTSPTLAIRKALALAGKSMSDMDYVELNEAYAAVVLANQQLLNLDLEKVNVYGGAVALGHPLGASGARILCTLVSVLHQENGKYGIAAICNGGGGASAMIIEKL